ncbi:unnamed protein product [Closterium sp. NIES-65]|nr:unnamed protein product [Closterium sp. NIES-65]
MDLPDPVSPHTRLAGLASMYLSHPTALTWPFPTPRTPALSPTPHAPALSPTPRTPALSPTPRTPALSPTPQHLRNFFDTDCFPDPVSPHTALLLPAASTPSPSPATTGSAARCASISAQHLSLAPLSPRGARGSCRYGQAQKGLGNGGEGGEGWRVGRMEGEAGLGKWARKRRAERCGGGEGGKVTESAATFPLPHCAFPSPPSPVLTAPSAPRPSTFPTAPSPPTFPSPHCALPPPPPPPHCALHPPPPPSPPHPPLPAPPSSTSPGTGASFVAGKGSAATFASPPSPSPPSPHHLPPPHRARPSSLVHLT